MMSNLMAEVNYLKESRGFGTREAIGFIEFYQKEYASEVRRELREYLLAEAEEKNFPRHFSSLEQPEVY
jgi:hypothetical protein